MAKWLGFGQSPKTQQADLLGPWFYCLKHHQVESFEGCKAVDRLGPYELREEAELALERVASRNQEWDGHPDEDDQD